MELDEKTVEDGSVAVATATPVVADASKDGKPRERNTRTRRGERKDTRAPRERAEFDQNIIEIRRVTRVVAGGRRFSFSVSMVIGDKNGRVGVGLGKATDTALAINKAVRDARKHLITIARNKTNSISHEVEAKYGASVVQLFPSPERGLIAGSAVRIVLELGGVTDIIGKIQSRTKSKLAIARATVAALKQI